MHKHQTQTLQRISSFNFAPVKKHKRRGHADCESSTIPSNKNKNHVCTTTIEHTEQQQ